VIAAVATPTPDPITMLVTMLPLIILFELSLLLARIFHKRAAGRPSRWDWDDDEPDGDDREAESDRDGLASVSQSKQDGDDPVRPRPEADV